MTKPARQLTAARSCCRKIADQIRKKTATSKEALPLIKMASFGQKRSAHNSLRTNENMENIDGVETDYDESKIPFEEALAVLRKAGIRCILYTSPSYIPGDKEKWRILAPMCGACRPAHGRRWWRG